METDKEYAIRLAMEYGFTGGFDALGNLTFDVTVVEAILEAIQHEREACESIEYDLAKSPAMFATMAEYKAYKDGVQDYRTKIIARGEA